MSDTDYDDYDNGECWQCGGEGRVAGTCIDGFCLEQDDPDCPYCSHRCDVCNSLLSAEARNRAKATWGEWEVITFPRGTVGKAWAAEFTTAHKNRVFSVLDRTLPNGIRHLAVSSLSGIRPDWYEMQRIKDELAGPDKTAVEVYPPSTEIVDGADMFHIWVLIGTLPFSLYHAHTIGEGEHG